MEIGGIRKRIDLLDDVLLRIFNERASSSSPVFEGKLLRLLQCVQFYVYVQFVPTQVAGREKLHFPYPFDGSTSKFSIVPKGNEVLPVLRQKPDAIPVDGRNPGRGFIA